MKAATKTVHLCVFFILIFLVSTLPAQVGFLDTAYYKAPSVENRATNGIALPDGSIAITGQFVFCNERTVSGVAKFKPNGEVDYGFNTGYGTTDPLTGAVGTANVVNYLPGGKFIIAGSFTKYNGTAINRVARLNADGSLDNTFNVGAGFDGSVFDSYLQPDGKMIFVGAFTKYNNINSAKIARINTDGSYDATFLIGTGGVGGDIFAHDVQADGKHIIAGNFTSFNGINFTKIARLNPDGTIDPSFISSGAGADNIINDVLVLPGGKIVAAGFFVKYDTITVNRIVRLHTNGTRDTTFQSGAGFNGGQVNGMAIQADGKILATGQFTSYAGFSINRIARLDSSGARDVTFTPGGGFNLSCNNVFVDSFGGIFVVGTSFSLDSFTRVRLAKLLPNGKPDHTFFGESKVNAQVMDAGLQSSGKAIIGGEFTKFNQISANRIARLNADGTYDNTFASGTGANGIIRTLVVLPDDKILIGGDFTFYNGTAANRMARLNADGTLDNTFAMGTGANSGGVFKIIVRGDGKIYAGGSFTQFNTASRSKIARLNTDGSNDNSFNVGTGFTGGDVLDMALQGDGQVIAVGGFTGYNSVASITRIARLNDAGVRDATLNPGTSTNAAISAVAIQTDGNIIIGGGFTTFNATSKLRIARLTSTGTLDASFTASITNGAVSEIAIFGATILAGGTFTAVNGLAQNHFSFFTSAGLVDTARFYQGRGIIDLLTGTTTVNRFLVDDNNKKIYIAGNFLDIHAAPAIRFGRLLMSNIEFLNAPLALCRGAVGNVYFAKRRNFGSGSSFIVQLSDSTGSFANPVNIGAGFNTALGYDSIDFLIPNNTPYGSNYKLRIVSSNPSDTSNLSRAISISANPPATITTSGPTTVCGGQSVVLTAQPAGATYNWSVGGNTQSITVTNSGSITVSVTAYNCAAVSSPINVSINPAPDSSISVLAASFCAGGSVTLTGAPNLTYNWSTGVSTQSITVTQSGNYSLTVTNPGGCVSDSTININLAAINNYLISPNGPTTFCQGGSVTLTAAPANTYHWSNNASTQSITVNSSGTHSVTVTDANCSATSTPVTVTVNSIPSAAVTPGGPITLCQGDSISLSAPANLVYAWSNGKTTQSQFVKTSGFYTVSVSDASTNCSAVSSAVSVQVSSSSTVTLNLPDSVCNGGGTVQLTGGSPSGGTYAGNGVSGSSFNPQTFANTRVTITYTYNSGNCSGTATDSVYVNVCTGIDDVAANAISVFPNPANNILFVQANGVDLKDIEISDMLGHVITRIQPLQGEIAVAVNISNLAAAPYILRIGNQKVRFIKVD